MIKFGEYILDVEHSRLLNSSDKSEILIEPKIFELLLLFIERPNAVISRQDILELLWAGTIVTDNAINKLIGNLRKLLADDAKKPNYIQTVPKRGYRLVCDVETLVINDSAKNHAKLMTKSSPPIASLGFLKEKRKPRIGISFAVILLITLSYFMMLKSSNNSSSNSSHSVALTRDQGAELSPIMHPNNKHLYYLKESDEHTSLELWLKNTNTSVTKQVRVKGNISQIISIIEDTNTNQTILFYLDLFAKGCGVYQEPLPAPEELNQASQVQKKLFDCADKRIKDIDYHVDQNAFYYAAQPKNYWPNQIYAFDVETAEHRIVTQSQPKGWGHHSLDISPNGEKLLIMSTDSDYKTQLLSLNLSDNKITKGIKFEKPVYEAIWHHDSEQVYYFAASPSQRILKSDINGENTTEVINISEEILPKLSRLPDGKNILFSTENKNYSNRWLISFNDSNSIDNSSVLDIYPALFHKSEQYLFVSKRSGRLQLYLANSQYKQAQIVTNLQNSQWLKYLSISEDDRFVLLNVDNKVYQVSVSALNPNELLNAFKSEHLIYESKYPIISLDWLTSESVAITQVVNGNPELVIVQLPSNKTLKLDGRWAYGLKDSEQPNRLYFIEQQSNTLYQANYASVDGILYPNQLSFINTQISLPTDFYHAKVDSNNLYYVNAENDKEYLYIIPINKKSETRKLPLSDFYSYDVSRERIIVSDSISRDGDVHRTMY
ncbi:winged helix-turn-helix domain-containing protein [Thalassotalea ganghwensis]